VVGGRILVEVHKQVQSFNTGRILLVNTNFHGKKPDKTKQITRKILEN
jgi:hypothetical protein